MNIFNKGVVQKKLEEIEIYSNQDGNSLISDLDKLVPGDPIFVGVDAYKGYLINNYVCPKCAKPIGDEIYMFSFCPNCGKRIKKI